MRVRPVGGKRRAGNEEGFTDSSKEFEALKRRLLALNPALEAGPVL